MPGRNLNPMIVVLGLLSLMALGCRSQLRWLTIRNDTPWAIQIRNSGEMAPDTFPPGATRMAAERIYRAGALQFQPIRKSSGEVIWDKTFSGNDLARIDDGESLHITIEEGDGSKP